MRLNFSTGAKIGAGIVALAFLAPIILGGFVGGVSPDAFVSSASTIFATLAAAAVAVLGVGWQLEEERKADERRHASDRAAAIIALTVPTSDAIKALKAVKNAIRECSTPTLAL